MVVFTNGCFDLFHVGHLRFLQWCKTLGDMLIVGVNSDDDIRRLKGREPAIPAEERREILLGLKVVDHALLFDGEEGLRKLILDIRPDVLAKGRPWAGVELTGQKEVESWNGTVMICCELHPTSTTAIRERIA